ncbi:DUF3551 domain-containing protein [Tardiphaga sp.]|jgi:hypothetical protein|uniref:DUF3551 domain-containing protein n=1 Tax=Tardiphaga sp. TaxID=1926292 RepID=UPI0037D9B135
MTFDLRLPALAGLATAGFLLAAPAPVLADGAQYCIAQSGANGSGSYVGNCIYTTYEQCSAAAVGTRGNCVGNVEYRGGSATSPTPRSRRMR